MRLIFFSFFTAVAGTMLSMLGVSFATGVAACTDAGVSAISSSSKSFTE